jgi:hypothetical protein
MIKQIAELFIALPRVEQIRALNVLAHLLPTSGVDYTEEENHSIEHTIDMLQNAISINEYTGPSREQLMAKVKLIQLEIEEFAETADEPGITYINPDQEIAISEEVNKPVAEEARR